MLVAAYSIRAAHGADGARHRASSMDTCCLIGLVRFEPAERVIATAAGSFRHADDR